jgi:hypothetical protein
MTGEVLKTIDLLVIFITFVGVSFITFGMETDKIFVSEEGNFWEISALIGAMAIPFVIAYGNVIMKQLKSINEHTVSLYINPSLTICMLLIVFIQG